MQIHANSNLPEAKAELQHIIEFHTTLRRMGPSAKSLAGPDKTLLKHVFNIS